MQPQACTEVGFFYLVNHGIPRELLNQVYAEMAHFFHQPAEEKQKVLANEYMRGYTLMNEETLDPNVQTQGAFLQIPCSLLLSGCYVALPFLADMRGYEHRGHQGGLLYLPTCRLGE